MKKPRTEAQDLCSRANGAKSRGPVTPRGKLKSSRNSLKHGLLATAVLLPGESRDRFLKLCTDLTTEYGPKSPTEWILLERIVHAQWRLVRLRNYERVAMIQEASAVAQVPEVITEAGVWFEPCARDTVAFHALHGRIRSGSVLQISELRYERQFALAVAQFKNHRERFESANPSPKKDPIEETNPGSPCNG